MQEVDFDEMEKRLDEAAERPDAEGICSAIRRTLAEGDRYLKKLIHYLMKQAPPPDPIDQNEAFYGAIPAIVEHETWIPKSLARKVCIPDTTITKKEWNDFKSKIAACEAVDADGSIYTPNTYGQLDWHWLYCLYHTRVSTFDASRFRTKPKVIQAPDRPWKLGIVGDWGTGDRGKYVSESPAGSETEHSRDMPSKQVMTELIKHDPDFVVHLGDVYYAGTRDSWKDKPNRNEEKDHLLHPWRYTGRSFTLNSNHEMYVKAKGYFDEALAGRHSPFRDQGASYFLIQSRDWQIFGLDTAFWSAGPMHMHPTLGQVSAEDGEEIASAKGAQAAFLRSKHDPGRKVMLLSHHHPINVRGTKRYEVWNQVESSLDGRSPDVWYWGHTHNAIVYNERSAAGMTRARCVGNSGIPYGFAWGLIKPDGLDGVEPGTIPDNWEYLDTIDFFAHKLATNRPGPIKGEIWNGFAILHFDGTALREEIYYENGELAWSSEAGARSTAEGQQSGTLRT